MLSSSYLDSLSLTERMRHLLDSGHADEITADDIEDLLDLINKLTHSYVSKLQENK